MTVKRPMFKALQTIHRDQNQFFLLTECLSSQGFVEFGSHQEAKGRRDAIKNRNAYLLVVVTSPPESVLSSGTPLLRCLLKAVAVKTLLLFEGTLRFCCDAVKNCSGPPRDRIGASFSRQTQYPNPEFAHQTSQLISAC